MGKIFDTLLGKSSTPAEEGDYMELNLEDYEGKEDAPARSSGYLVTNSL